MLGSGRFVCFRYEGRNAKSIRKLTVDNFRSGFQCHLEGFSYELDRFLSGRGSGTVNVRHQTRVLFQL
jgi:hypothetical protein